MMGRTIVHMTAPFNVRDGMLCGLTETARTMGGHDWRHDWGRTLRSERYYLQCEKCGRWASLWWGGSRKQWQAGKTWEKPCQA